MVQINAYNSSTTTNISLLSQALPRKILVFQQQCVGVCVARARGEVVRKYLQGAPHVCRLSPAYMLREGGRGEGVEELGAWLRYTITYLSS